MTCRPDLYDALPRRFSAAAHFVDRHVVEGRADNVAVVSAGRRITYGEMHAQVNRVGNALRRLGVRIEERVPLLLRDGPEFVSSFWGAMKIGAVPVPVSPLLRQPEWEYILDDSRARIAIVDETLEAGIDAARPRLERLERVLVAGEPRAGCSFHELVAEQSAELAPADTTKDDVAFWMYTSGSTGTPKAAMHLQHDMLVCCETYARSVLGIGEADRCYSTAKLCFAYGLGNALYFPFHVGAATVLDAERPTPARIAELITRERPTLFFAVPTTYSATLRAAEAGDAEFDLGSLRCCVSAGEPLPRSVHERWRERFGLEILDGLGSTELCHIAISNRPGGVRPGSVGTVVPGYDAKIVDDDGVELPTPEIGHLMVQGESACAGYWNQHARTKQTFVGEWVRTGDRCFRDAEGRFWFVGRSDDMFKVGGIWVSPIEVEGALLEHAAVTEAAVVGAAAEDHLVRPLAFVVLASGHEPTPSVAAELQDFVCTRLGRRKTPRSVVFVPELPKSATGKVQRFRLRERAG
jgi:benzoate-CoA ligase